MSDTVKFVLPEERIPRSWYNLLADLPAPSQYAQNVATRPGSAERVEFAVRFPGRGEAGTACWLPIDAKFPLEDWQRLQEAVERADVAAVEAARRSLDAFFKAQAKTIRDKYVEPPHTTDFAILFVPTEGLFAEAVARPGLADALQRDFRVTLAGPTTLAAMLNSLQLGFRTLAIEKRSTEVWRVLDRCHQLRNLGEYEGDLNIDERIVTDLLGACRTVAARVQALGPLATP